jgi:hypothetical protein
MPTRPILRSRIEPIPYTTVQKDDRPDHHLDEGNKAVAERLESFAQVRPEMANKNANSDSYQNLDVEDRIPRAVRAHCDPRTN